MGEFGAMLYFFVLGKIFEIIAVDLCSQANFSSEVSEYFAKNISEKNCGCDSCIRRCCKPGFVYFSQFCYDGSSELLQVPVYIHKTRFVDVLSSIDHFMVGVPNCTLFRLDFPFEEFYIQNDNKDVWVPMYNKFYNSDRYCVDELSGFTPFLCFTNDKREVPSDEKIAESNTFGMIISMPFLFITFLVYFILPERNVHRRALMNYVLSLLCGYISLVTIQLFKNETTPLPEVQCQMIGYSIVFFFIVSFFWMNVMCIDMWLAFSGLRRFGGRKNAEQKKFILFCIYAWGMPALLILIIYLMNTYADRKAIYHPQLGTGRCFLEEGYPNLFYFYLPMAILITINIILCILTAVRIQTVKKETSMLKHGDSKRHSYESDKQKFNLYIKLIFAMGINWSMEVISWVILWQWHDLPTYIWYLTDFANAAYGVFIFFIFVFKKNVWLQLKKRYYIWRGQPHLAHTLSSTQNTRTSNFSTSDSFAVSADYKLNDLRSGRFEEKPLSNR